MMTFSAKEAVGFTTVAESLDNINKNINCAIKECAPLLILIRIVSNAPLISGPNVTGSDIIGLKIF